MADVIHAVAGDTRTIPLVCKIDGTAVTFTGDETVEVHQVPRGGGTAITSHTATVDADQVTNTGHVNVQFTSTELVAGEYTLEVEVDGTRTYPDDPDDRPLLLVRAQNG